MLWAGTHALGLPGRHAVRVARVVDLFVVLYARAMRRPRGPCRLVRVLRAFVRMGRTSPLAMSLRLTSVAGLRHSAER